MTPVLLLIVVGMVLALVTWGLVRVDGHQSGDASLEPRDDVIYGLLVLALIILAIFVAYVLIGIGS